MAWQYSNALNGALLAASNGGQSDTLGLGTTNSLYKPYFSSYDPFTSRYQPRASNFFERRSPPSIFDDLELELEVDDSILSSTRYRQPLYSNHNQPAYVPSYFNSLKTSLNNQNRSYDNNNNNNNFYSESINEQVVSLNNLEQLKQNQQSNTSNDNLTQKSKPTYANKPKKTNNINTTTTNKNQTKKQVNPNLASKIQPAFNTNSYQSQHQPQQQQQQIINNNPTPNFQRLFQPIPFQNETPTIMNNINSVESSADLGSISNHNNQQLRFLQYQQRLLQQQEMNKNQSLSELEILKLKQQQDKQQLMQAIAANNNSNNNNNAIKKGSEKIQQYQPFFEEHHLKQKQYSETSIPSTNADPLYSNSPTPPLGVPNHRLPRVNFDTNPVQINKQTNNNTKMAQTKKGFYFKLNENNTNNIKSSDDLPEIGSYMNTMRDARIREQQRLSKDKYTTQDYKQYQKNYGFGRDFLPFENETKKEKLEKARKREEYSKMIKERNAILMDGGYTMPQNNKYNPSINSNQEVQAQAPTTKRSFGDTKTKIKL